MKELSIEQKARAYDEAIERARVFKEHLLEINEKDYAGEMDYIFPELTESKDERIRAKLIEFFVGYTTDEKWWGSVTEKDILAWLEKRDEQKEVEPTPIFRIGDILKRKGKDYTFRVDRIQGGCYHCDRNHGAFFPIEEQNNWELVEQKPAEWSEEDEKILGDIIKDLVHPWNEYIPDRIEDEIKWLKNKLKSRRPEPNWKPSDEHYELEEFAKIVRGNLTGISKAVQKLFEAKYLQLTGNKMYGGFKD